MCPRSDRKRAHLVRCRPNPDASPFLRDDFDAQSYASQFLGSSLDGGKPKEDDEKKMSMMDRVASVDSDMRVALSRLNMSITEVDQQIHTLVGVLAHTDHLALQRLSRACCQCCSVARIGAVHSAGAREARRAGYSVCIYAYPACAKAFPPRCTVFNRPKYSSSMFSNLRSLYFEHKTSRAFACALLRRWTLCWNAM